jgi:hypothetical protein
MNKRWFLSQFYVDTELNMPIPICTAYGSEWHCPTMPADINTGWALVVMHTSTHQIDAASQDPRVLVCPLIFDPTPVAQCIIDAYEHWGAIAGMSLGALLAKLAETEPIFGHI